MKVRYHKQTVGLLLSILVMVFTLAGSACFAEQVLKVGGTGAALGSMSKMAEAFHKLHPDIVVKILPSLGSSGGIKAVAGGAIDLAFSSKPLKAEEPAAGLTELEYARTPFVFVTREPVGVDGVTSEGVVRMFSGATSTWPNGQRIRPIIRPNEETDMRIAKSVSPALSKILDSLQSVPGMVIVLTDQDCSAAIGTAAGTLAFSSLAQVQTWNRKYVVLSFNGVVPNAANVSNGSYPFFRPLYIVRKGESNANAKLFVDFVKSAQGRRILAETGNLAMMSALAEN